MLLWIMWVDNLFFKPPVCGSPCAIREAGRRKSDVKDTLPPQRYDMLIEEQCLGGWTVLWLLVSRSETYRQMISSTCS